MCCVAGRLPFTCVAWGLGDLEDRVQRSHERVGTHSGEEPEAKEAQSKDGR